MARFTVKQRRDEGQPLASELLKLKAAERVRATQLEQERRSLRKRVEQKLKDSRLRLRKKHAQISEEMEQIAKDTFSALIPQVEQKAIQQLEEECIALCFTITRQFLGELLPDDKERLKQRVEQSLSEISSKRGAIIHLNPKDREIADLMELTPNHSIRVAYSEDQQRGKARVSTADRDIIIDWENELEQYALRFMTKYSSQTHVGVVGAP